MPTLCKVVVKDSNGNYKQVSITDPQYLSGELVSQNKGLITLLDKNGNTVRVTTSDPRIKSKELTHATKGTVSVRDKNGNTFRVSSDDKRLQTGELVGVMKGVKLSESQKVNICREGSLNPAYGTKLYNNGVVNKRFKIDSYVPSGWVPGRLK